MAFLVKITCVIVSVLERQTHGDWEDNQEVTEAKCLRGSPRRVKEWRQIIKALGPAGCR